jgi:hypothetical protein
MLQMAMSAVKQRPVAAEPKLPVRGQQPTV